MSDSSEQLTNLRARLDDASEQLERHRHVVEGIGDNPQDYDSDDVDNYLSTLDEALPEDFLDDVDQALEPLEEATEAAAEALLDDATVAIDDQVIEGIEVTELDDTSAEKRARILVESPKVNQLRGGRPRLELPDGRQFTFTILETHIAEVSEDKTGYLELVLGLEEM